MEAVCCVELPGTGRSPVELERCCQRNSAAGTESGAIISAVPIASGKTFISSENSCARFREAALACLANAGICSISVMRREVKPKSRSEKGEVLNVSQYPAGRECPSFPGSATMEAVCCVELPGNKPPP